MTTPRYFAYFPRQTLRKGPVWVLSARRGHEMRDVTTGTLEQIEAACARANRLLARLRRTHERFMHTMEAR